MCVYIYIYDMIHNIYIVSYCIVIYCYYKKPRELKKKTWNRIFRSTSFLHVRILEFEQYTCRRVQDDCWIDSHSCSLNQYQNVPSFLLISTPGKPENLHCEDGMTFNPKQTCSWTLVPSSPIAWPITWLIDTLHTRYFSAGSGIFACHNWWKYFEPTHHKGSLTHVVCEILLPCLLVR